MKRSFLFVLFISFSFSLSAQQIRPATAAQLYQQIAALKNLTHVLYLAAHPDDENTRLLAWLVGDQHIPTAYLSLTRGDGGQNILGPQLGPALGLIRTHELLEARKLDGAGQFFTRAIDFGFSKSWQETFQHWDSTLLTGDVVHILRQYRPDVVICRFPPDTRAGHGQHAASAIIARKAFFAAGDPQQYRVQNLPAWQPRRLLWNTFSFGRLNTTSEDQFKLRVGQYSPLLGMGYGELAGISRSIHRSQGAGTPSVPGVQNEYFEMVAGDSVKNSLFDGIDITWNRVGRPEIGTEIEAILKAFDFNQPEAALPALLELHRKIATVKDAFWREQKLRALDQIILDAAGFMAEATTAQATATAGSTVPYTLRLVARAQMPVQVEIAGQGDSAVRLGPLQNDSLYAVNQTFVIPQNQPLTQPYWLALPAKDDHFLIPADSLLGLPETPNSLVVHLKVMIGSEHLDVRVPLSYKKLDPLYGDVVEALRVVPELSVSMGDDLVLTRADGSVKSYVRLRSFAPVQNANLALEVNGKTLYTLKGISMNAGTDTSIPFQLAAHQVKEAGNGNFELALRVAANGKTYDKTLNLIQYTHIPTLQYFTPAKASVVAQDWQVTAKRIGYVPGAGDFIPDFLKLAGLDVTILTPEALGSAARLKDFDAIITGIRAVNTEKEMKFWLPVLLEYVHQGGTLVMQYNTLQDMATKDLGPYPFQLSSKRVTEENAKVDITNAISPLLNTPNKITQQDFEGWVQERGLYFPDKWDERYQTLFKMHDAGEEPLAGSTIYASYGKGMYVYTSLSFFRQLPAGNAGAIRLLMNMLSAKNGKL